MPIDIERLFRKNFPRQHRHMMRLWKSSFRLAPMPTVLYALLPVFCGGWLGAKLAVTTIDLRVTPELPANSSISRADPVSRLTVTDQLLNPPVVDGPTAFYIAPTANGAYLENVTIEGFPHGVVDAGQNSQYRNLEIREIAPQLTQKANKGKRDSAIDFDGTENVYVGKAKCYGGNSCVSAENSRNITIDDVENHAK